MKKHTAVLLVALTAFPAICLGNDRDAGSDLATIFEFKDKATGRFLEDGKWYWVDEKSVIVVKMLPGCIIEYVVMKEGKERKRNEFKEDEAQSAPKIRVEAGVSEIADFYAREAAGATGRLKLMIEFFKEHSAGMAPPKAPLPGNPGKNPTAGDDGGNERQLSIDDFVGYFYFPVSEKTDKVRELGYVGEVVYFNCYVPQRYGKRRLVKQVCLEIIKSGPVWVSKDNIAWTSLVNIELAKKKGEDSDGRPEKAAALSPGIGFGYLVFFKYPRHPRLYNLGLGVNLSYSKTELWDDAESKMKSDDVLNAGFAVAYRLEPMLLGLILGTNVGSRAGDYFQIGLAIGSLPLGPGKTPTP